MKSMQEEIAGLTPEQRALLIRLLDKSQPKGGDGQPALQVLPLTAPIPRRDPGERCPASLDQERLWFLHLMDPQSPAYNVDIPMRIQGEVEIAALKRALNEIVRRHEAWRTTFAVVDGEPVQIVAPALIIGIPVIDLRGVPEGGRDAAAMELVYAEIRRPFDLETGPLVRFTVLWLGAENYLLVLVVHHIATDWISMKRYWNELVVLYSAFAAGRPSPLPELAIHYPDFAVWQRKWLAEGGLEKHMQYWREHLAGAPLVLDLPTDRPRQPVQTGRGTSYKLALDLPTSAAVRRLSQRESASSFMTLMAAFKALLLRFTGQDKIILGSPSANRNRPELEPVLGFFLTQLVFYTDLSGNPTFVELVRRERQTALGAYAHQEVPFSVLLKELDVERDLSRPPVVQATFFTLEQGENQLPSHQIEILVLEDGSARWDLTLFFFDNLEKGFYGWFEYNVDLFDRTTVARLGESFQTLLAAALADETARLADLPCLSETQQHQILREWGDARRPGGEERPVHELFRAQALRTPEAAAVTSGGESLTYRELDRRSNRLAHRLRRLGVGPEARVAVCLERAVDLPVALLAVLKAGGAFVPIDPAHPEQRKELLIADSGAVVVLSQDNWPETAGEPEDAPAPAVSGADLAYLIYTSGTTGTPKAVLVEHRSFTATLTATLEAFAGKVGDVVPVLASAAFDIFLFELFHPLLSGGTAVLVPLHPAPDVEALVGLLAGAARFHAVPSLMRQIVEQARVPGPAGFSLLREVFVGGDAVPAELLAGLRAAFPAARLQILYGPTEATIVCAGHTVARQPELERPLIGRPFAGTVLALADAGGQAVPVGVAGELWIGGAAVTRGYLHQPELTAEKYVLRAGERFFRTGDRMRFLADGTLEFLGRIDQQVKIRGFRVELAEVETVLASLPAVRQAVAAARDGRAGERRLVAWLVPEEGLAPSAGELRAALKTRLPEYMIPSAFVTLAALPLTPLGKVDHRALPEPGPERPALDSSYIPPHNGIEEKLAAIWATVLGLERVGVEDNFFALGGDSILSIQLVSRAKQAGLGITPKLVFQYPTVAALAAMVEAAPSRASEQGAVTGPVPLTPVQSHFFDLGFDNRHHFNQSLLLATEKAVEAPWLDRAVQALLLHHDALRHRFLPSSGSSAQTWRQVAAEPGGSAPCGFVDLAALPAERRRGQVEAVSAALQGSLDLERGPVFRAASFGLGAGEPGQLVLIAHHLVMDFFSWRPLLEDLLTAAQQASRGEAIVLPPKTSSFKDWAEGLAARAASPAVQAELPYWLDERAERAGRITPDVPAGRNTMASARSLAFALDAEPSHALLEVIPTVCRLDVQEVVLAALARVVAARTGRRLLVVDCEAYGRDVLEGLDLERTVGWFTWTYPLLLDLEGAGDPGTELKAVKERLRGVPSRGLGYGLLRHLTADAGTAARFRAHPEAEIGFNYVGRIGRLATPASSLQASSLQASSQVQEAPGTPVAVEGLRPHQLDITVSAGDRLHVVLMYSESLFGRAAIEGLAADLLAEVGKLAEHCLSTRFLAATPSDFPLARLDQETLDTLMADRNVEDLYPLTPLQQGMLFHGLYAPEEGLYVNQTVWELQQQGLDLPAFLRAWQAVTDRHPVLRTGFVWERSDRPLQRVLRTVELPAEELDWRGLAREEVQARLADFLAADRRRGFDLQSPPLMRLTSMPTSGEERIFVWTSHHLLFDGWCLSLIFQEVQDCYQAFCAGRTWTAPRPRPYRDYIAWQEAQGLAQAETYWRACLAGFTAPTRVSLLRPAFAGAGGSGVSEERGELQVFLPPPETAALAAAARQSGLTLSTLLQAAWALWLSRSSGEDDVVFGITVSGRPAGLPGVESMIGLFLNTLPVRVRIAPEAPLLPWLGELQEQLVEMRQFEHTPLADVQRWSGIPAGQALFETLSVFENHPVDPAVREQRAGLAVRSMRTLEKTNYPIALTVVPGPRMILTLVYDAARLDRGAALRTVEQLKTVLEALAAPSVLGAGQEQRIGGLPFLTAAELHQTTVEWSASGPEWEEWDGALVPERFAALAARQPQAPAVVCGGEELTYGELDRRAGDLAAELRALGVAPEARVALCLRRSLDLAVAILAVWKAGGAYVPLDPDYPPRRLALLLRDSRPALVLTSSSLTGVLPAHDLPLLLLDARETEQQAADRPVPSGAGAQTPAYVIYTSGTTGEPKGVVVEHRGLANLAAAQIAAFALRPGSRLLAFASPSFDASVSEIVTALCSGSALYLEDRETLLPGPPLFERLRDLAITCVTLPPTALASLPAADLPALETLVVAGEACPPELAALWGSGRRAGRRAGFRFINAYGPTESTVCATLALLGEDGRAPIGRPLAGLAAYVLDRHAQAVPLGVAGELCIGGAGLARGYAGQPRTTAEKFVPAPLGEVPGARLYRSGDLVRWAADGRLDFLGRIDHQVKVRGFRVELGEVEAALRQAPAVQDAVVALHEAGGGGRRLLGYVVPREGMAPSTSELRAFLRERLPDFMTPALFIVLPEIPLTPAGKVDRRALPGPDAAGRPQLDREYTAPRNPVEEQLAAIWARVLRVQRVGIYDNFFDLGGDSILSLQIVSRANRAGLGLTPRQIFQHQTVADLATVAGKGAALGHEQGLVTGPVPLTPIQHWMFERDLPDPHRFDQAIQLDLPEGLDARLLSAAVAALVAHHDALRLRFTRDESGWRQNNAGLPDPASCTWIDLAALPEARRGAALAAAAAEVESALDFIHGPLLRAACFAPVPGGARRLLLAVHHLGVDAVSWRILIEDLETACRQLARGAAVELPPKTTSFKRWAELLAEHARSGALAAETACWERLDAHPAPLPVDLPGGVNDLGSLRTVSFRLDPETTRALLQDVPAVYRTEINDVLLTALAQCCAEWTGRRRLLVDLEGHGREDLFPGVDLSRTVGWFTTLYPVLLDLGEREAADTGDEIMRIKEGLRAIPQHGIGYGLLRHLGTAETAARLRELPRAEVAFNYLGQVAQAAAASGEAPEEAAGHGPAMSPRTPRAHLLEIDGRVAGGQLHIGLSYSANVHHRTTIERLAEDYLEALCEIVAHCQSPEAGGSTLSDFPLARLEEDDLERLLREVGFE